MSEYRKAAEQGDALAQFHLGQMYESGKGIPQNYVLAYAWLSVAVANEISEPTDHELAIQLRDEVGQKLPPHALSEAQQLAAQYFEQYVADE